jgi:hypothetical protein
VREVGKCARPCITGIKSAQRWEAMLDGGSGKPRPILSQETVCIRSRDTYDQPRALRVRSRSLPGSIQQREDSRGA